MFCLCCSFLVVCFVKKRVCVWASIWLLLNRERDKCLLIGSCVVLSSTHCAERQGAEEGVPTGSYCLHCKQRIFFIKAWHCLIWENSWQVNPWLLKQGQTSGKKKEINLVIHWLVALNLTEITVLGLRTNRHVTFTLLIRLSRRIRWNIEQHFLLVFMWNPLPRQLESNESCSLILCYCGQEVSPTMMEELNLMNH